MISLYLLLSVVLKLPTVLYGSMKTVPSEEHHPNKTLLNDAQMALLLLFNDKLQREISSKEVPSVALDLRGSEWMAAESTIFNHLSACGK